MKKLPLGISSFKKIREQGYTYVDKSRFVYDLAERGTYYFLSRPRRFGKSLFIDTLKEAFQGNQELFRGLWIHDHWDWNKRFPVVHISFAEGMLKSRNELDQKIRDLLSQNETALGITCRQPNDISGYFSEVIRNSAQKSGRRTVVLIDEYDKPILDNIVEPKIAEEMREGLKNLYSVIKGQDANIEFAFLTGVSKFSKVSLFSGLNNLKDITLDSRYATICGYTEPEMTTVFAKHLTGRPLADIRKWYNGYAWLGEKVYNPFSILNYLQDGCFKNYWFETGTPEFLIRLILSGRYFLPGLQDAIATENLLGSFDINAIEVETIMFQAGYLTIKEQQQYGNLTAFRLGFPNLEVEMSFADTVCAYLVSGRPAYEKHKIDLYKCLAVAKIEAIKGIFHALFAAIPHDWYRKNKLCEYEGYYASIFFCYFTALGLDVTAEDTTSHGRIDMTVQLEGRIYIFEFKVKDIDKTPGTALAQIRQKRYADKYRSRAGKILLIGVEFDRGTRNIVRFEWEQA